MGTLTGSNTVLAGTETFNLSSPAQTDWMYCQADAVNVIRKSGGGSSIGLPTLLATNASGSSFSSQSTDGPGFTWTDGTPTGSATAAKGGIYVDWTTTLNVGDGFQYNLPADTTERTAVIYWGMYSGQAKLTATLSDGSATAYTLTPTATGSGNEKFYSTTITFAANSAGQTLNIKIVLNTKQGTSYNPMYWGTKLLASAPSGITGSGADTQGKNTSTASGTVSISGTAADTQGKNSTTASGSVSVSGTAAVTQQLNTSAASGTVGVSGTATLTEGLDTSTASGTVSVSGTAAVTQAKSTSSGTGTVAISGTGSASGKGTSSGTGTVGITGTAALTEGKDTSTASGDAPISGTAALTQAKDVANATGDAPIAGTAALTQAKNVANATGDAPVSGTAALTEGKDTSAASGAVGITGTAAVTQAKNTSSASGTVATTGTASDTQAKNTSSATGAVSIDGTASDTQAPNTSAASGTPIVAGTASLTEGKDTSAASGAVAITGTAALTQEKNTTSATGAVIDGIIASGAVTQAPNASSASGTVSIDGSAAESQAKNTSAASGTVGITGTATDAQTKNTSAAAGTVGITGTAAITQKPNVSSANGGIGDVISGSAADTQAPNVSSGTGTVGITGTGACTQKPSTSAASGAVSIDGSAALAQARDVVNAFLSTLIDGYAAVTQARNVMNGVGTVSSNESTGTAADTQAPNVSSATGEVSITGSADIVQKRGTSYGRATVTGGEEQLPTGNPILNRGRTMKWFQAGEDLTFDIEILVNGLPANPDVGTVTFTVRDQSGATIDGLVDQPVSVPGTTASISLPASANTLADGSDNESRFVTLKYIAQGQSRQLRTSYSLHAFLPIEASCDAVRSLVGVSSDELPDDDIALVLSYFDLVAEEGDTFKQAFTARNQTRAAANRALALHAALDAVPSLQLRIFQSRQSENSSFSRFAGVDFERLKSDLRDQLAAALKQISSPTTTASTPTYFMVSTPTDNVTNS